MIGLAVVGAPLVEELFFRGLLQGAFTRRIGAVPALFITAIIFCFAHVLERRAPGPPCALPMALVLGYLRTGPAGLQRAWSPMLSSTPAFFLFLVPAFR